MPGTRTWFYETGPKRRSGVLRGGSGTGAETSGKEPRDPTEHLAALLVQCARENPALIQRSQPAFGEEIRLARTPHAQQTPAGSDLLLPLVAATRALTKPELEDRVSTALARARHAQLMASQASDLSRKASRNTAIATGLVLLALIAASAGSVLWLRASAERHRTELALLRGVAGQIHDVAAVQGTINQQLSDLQKSSSAVPRYSPEGVGASTATTTETFSQPPPEPHGTREVGRGSSPTFAEASQSFAPTSVSSSAFDSRPPAYKARRYTDSSRWRSRPVRHVRAEPQRLGPLPPALALRMFVRTIGYEVRTLFH